ncbi:MAG: adenylate/guanylate cyclase domain-containing protein [Hyphomicrobiales bacterium]|nr:adenylate/guanylate cyclase domain-containing protein [Hyphomicrobiales bacterium]
MQIQSASKNRILTWLAVVVFGALAGQGYTTLTYDTIPPEILKTWPGLRGGAVVAGLSGGFEIFVMRGVVGTWFRRQAFLVALFIRILTHTAFVVFALLGNRASSALMIGQIVPEAFILREIVQDVFYAFMVVAVALFVLQMRTLIGGRTLLNVVLGRYYRPVTEQRLFIMIDLTGSTPLAARIGDERFHDFLSAFFFEIDAAVTQFGGEVYSYIGDGVIVSWPLRDGRPNARAVEAIFAARERLDRRSSWFRSNFGQAPAFHAVLHGGSVVAGECGDSRRQITYLGDVLNTTARLEGLSKQLDVDCMISNDLLQQTTLPGSITATDLGQHTLKGVAAPVAVSALKIMS